LTQTAIIMPSLLSLLLALALGAAVGLERQIRHHPAGLHTNALVCLGSAAYVLVALFVTDLSSPARIAGQVVTGVGFMCAGVIWHEGPTVRGLNTAATVWCTAAVGILAGLGYSWMAILAAGVLLMANVVLHWVEHRFLSGRTRKFRDRKCRKRIFPKSIGSPM
jgi:putative Mg2+ transporter-C (MgtC) family protein